MEKKLASIYQDPTHRAKLWSAIKEQIHKKLEVYLEDSWLKYLFRLVKVHDTGA